MSDRIDDLLREGFAVPPENFTEQVMARLEALPAPAIEQPAGRARERLQWLALAGAGLLGIAELSAFVFGIWSATAAG